MNCCHVLGLIDAGPFTDYPREHLEAAWEHARRCPGCAAALATTRRLAADIATMAPPSPPSYLEAAVMTRIAQLEDGRQLENPPLRAVERALGDWTSLLTALGAAAAALAFVLPLPSSRALLLGLLEPRSVGGLSGLATLPATAGASLAMAAGLTLYALGLVTGQRRRKGRS